MKNLLKIQNLFSRFPESISKEIFETLLKTESFKLERIISTGQSTTAKKWLNQDTNEWVILLKGSAGLLFKEENKILTMKPGDYIHIPAHKLHRVEWTDKNEPTIWLALHYK